jgi:hypothetical protein
MNFTDEQLLNHIIPIVDTETIPLVILQVYDEMDTAGLQPVAGFHEELGFFLMSMNTGTPKLELVYSKLSEPSEESFQFLSTEFLIQ